MHELSLVFSIIDTVIEALTPYPGARVKEVRLRIGALAAVEEESLQFCFGMATEDTPLASSILVVRKAPVVVHCTHCGETRELPSLQSFRCPECSELAYEVLQGREMEIEDIEIEDGK
jgi:hydrogenase nickel incorporation protein HypA/HybF